MANLVTSNEVVLGEKKKAGGGVSQSNRGMDFETTTGTFLASQLILHALVLEKKSKCLCQSKFMAAILDF
jgi:hypothetical protein